VPASSEPERERDALTVGPPFPEAFITQLLVDALHPVDAL
jgi:hypothetical protein